MPRPLHEARGSKSRGLPPPRGAISSLLPAAAAAAAGLSNGPPPPPPPPPKGWPGSRLRRGIHDVRDKSCRAAVRGVAAADSCGIPSPAAATAAITSGFSNSKPFSSVTTPPASSSTCAMTPAKRFGRRPRQRTCRVSPPAMPSPPPTASVPGGAPLASSTFLPTSPDPKQGGGDESISEHTWSSAKDAPLATAAATSSTETIETYVASECGCGMSGESPSSPSPTHTAVETAKSRRCVALGRPRSGNRTSYAS